MEIEDRCRIRKVSAAEIQIGCACGDCKSVTVRAGNAHDIRRGFCDRTGEGEIEEAAEGGGRGRDAKDTVAAFAGLQEGGMSA